MLLFIPFSVTQPKFIPDFHTLTIHDHSAKYFALHTQRPQICQKLSPLSAYIPKPDATKKMTQYIQQLNSVYEKMITAMTINMYRPMGGAPVEMPEKPKDDTEQK